MRNCPLYNVRPINSLKDMIQQNEELFGDKNAFLIKKPDGRYSGITYGRLKREMDAIGTRLLKLGLKDKLIAVIGENRYEWCVTYLATVNGTGVIVPIDKELPSDEIEFLLKRCGAEAIVYSSKYEKTVLEISNKMPSLKYLISMDRTENTDRILAFCQLLREGEALLVEGDSTYLDVQIDNCRMSTLLFTSGTTGVSKGVMLSHKNLCANITSVSSTVYVDSSDTVLSILPLHHTYECTIGFLTVIYNGGSIAFCEGLKHIARNLKEVRPTILVSVPLIIENAYNKIWEHASKKKGMKTFIKLALASSNFLYKIIRIDIRKQLFKQVHENFGGRLRLLISGAAALDPVVSKGFRDFGILVLQGYGLTECSPLVTGNRDRLWADGSIGLPIPGVEVKVGGPNEKGVGELLVKGENVMLGYYQDDEATANALKDGWFHTGDLGRHNEDGLYYITGRSKNVIVTKNGKNIYPEELEAYIGKSPLVSEVLVWGKYDKASGETLVNAQIFPNLDAIKEKTKLTQLTTEDILNQMHDVIRNVNRSIPIYKHIRNFSIRDSEFIKTTTRKIKRFMADVESKGTVRGKV